MVEIRPVDPYEPDPAESRPAALAETTTTHAAELGDDVVAPSRSRAEIESELDTAEQAYQSQDSYRVAAGYDAAGRLYQELACQVDDRLLAAACIQAGQQYQTLAAQTRFGHGIPTLTPRREAGLLGMNGRCGHCGRAWSLDPDAGCEQCPRVLFGPSPQSAAEAEQLPPPPQAEPDTRQ